MSPHEKNSRKEDIKGAAQRKNTRNQTELPTSMGTLFVSESRVPFKETSVQYNSSKPEGMRLEGKTASIREAIHNTIQMAKTPKSKEKKETSSSSSSSSHGISKKGEKTIKQVEKEYKETLGTKVVRLTGLDPVLMEATLMEMKKVYSDFPKLKEYVTEISGSGSIGEKVFATTKRDGPDGESGIGFNEQTFGSEEKATADYKEQLSLGASPKSTTVAHVGVHELGHAIIEMIATIDSRENIDKYPKENTYKRVKKKIENTIIDEAYQNLKDPKLRKEEEIRSLSFYAYKNHTECPGETISEALADYYANDTSARKFSILIHQSLLTKYTDLFGIIATTKRSIKKHPLKSAVGVVCLVGVGLIIYFNMFK